MGNNKITKRKMPETRAHSEDYDTNYFLDICGGEKDYINRIFGKRFYEAVNLAQVKSGETILDVGGGRGETSILCASKGASVITIDYSPVAIALTKSLIKDFPQFKDRIFPKVMDAKTIKFKNSSFDKIFLLEVIEHLTKNEIDQVLTNILRVLKPDGKLIISTGPNKILMNLLLKIAEIFLGNKQWKSRKYHISEQSFFSLKSLFNNYDITYKIHPEYGKNFFNGQTYKNPNINPKVKIFIKHFNDFYDLNISWLIRRIPLLNLFFCTSFLIELRKAVKK